MSRYRSKQIVTAIQFSPSLPVNTIPAPIRSVSDGKGGVSHYQILSTRDGGGWINLKDGDFVIIGAGDPVPADQEVFRNSYELIGE